MRLSTEPFNLSIIFLLLLVSLTGCAKSHITVNNEQGTCGGDGNYGPGVGMTFEAYAKSLPDPNSPSGKMKVGFDIDDTLLFSYPAIHFREMQIKRCIETKNNNNEHYIDDYKSCKTLFNKYMLTKQCPKLSDQSTYPSLSNVSQYDCLDDLSLPKMMAKKLLTLHLNRGNIIYIITARAGVNFNKSAGKTSPSPDQDAVAKSLRLAFDLDEHDLPSEQIIFAQTPKNKHNFINKYKLSYYYGDADTDMTESLMTKATPIRIQRSPASLTNTSAYPGKFGEVVILNSEY